MGTQRLYIVNGLVMRLVPELAIEIGLHESLILLQIDFLLATKGVLPPGDIKQRPWIKISLHELQSKCFPFWNESTLSRDIESMIERGLLLLGAWDDKDTTRWFTYGPECVNLINAKMMEVDAQPLAKKKPARPAADKKEADAGGIWQVAVALADVCNMDFGMNKGRLLREAKNFADKPPENIIALFGKGSPWYTQDFRGKAGSPPSLAQVRTEWTKMGYFYTQAKQRSVNIKAPDGGLNV